MFLEFYEPLKDSFSKSIEIFFKVDKIYIFLERKQYIKRKQRK